MSDVVGQQMSESPENLARTWLRAWDTGGHGRGMRLGLRVERPHS
jgi:hypothetical protein